MPSSWQSLNSTDWKFACHLIIIRLCFWPPKIVRVPQPWGPYSELFIGGNWLAISPTDWTVILYVDW